jgi:hypothetical protein
MVAQLREKQCTRVSPRYKQKERDRGRAVLHGRDDGRGGGDDVDDALAFWTRPLAIEYCSREACEREKSTANKKEIEGYDVERRNASRNVY